MPTYVNRVLLLEEPENINNVIMTKKIFAVVLFTFTLVMVGCQGKRIGAVCEDGSRSTATGSGACSHHGGVDYWLYE